jgi:hypothetical protein
VWELPHTSCIISDIIFEFWALTLVRTPAASHQLVGSLNNSKGQWPFWHHSCCLTSHQSFLELVSADHAHRALCWPGFSNHQQCTKGQQELNCTPGPSSRIYTLQRPCFVASRITHLF